MCIVEKQGQDHFHVELPNFMNRIFGTRHVAQACPISGQKLGMGGFDPRGQVASLGLCTVGLLLGPCCMIQHTIFLLLSQACFVGFPGFRLLVA